MLYIVPNVIKSNSSAESGDNHQDTFDRFFTSNLLDKLNRSGINVVGTILPSRVNQAIMMRNESNLQQNEFVAKFGGEPGTCRKGIFIWKDVSAHFQLPWPRGCSFRKEAA